MKASYLLLLLIAAFAVANAIEYGVRNQDKGLGVQDGVDSAAEEILPPEMIEAGYNNVLDIPEDERTPEAEEVVEEITGVAESESESEGASSESSESNNGSEETENARIPRIISDAAVGACECIDVDYDASHNDDGTCVSSYDMDVVGGTGTCKDGWQWYEWCTDTIFNFVCADRIHFVAQADTVRIQQTDNAYSGEAFITYLDGSEIFRGPEADWGVAYQDDPDEAWSDSAMSSGESKSVSTTTGQSHELTFSQYNGASREVHGSAWVRICQGEEATLCGDPHFVGFNGEGYDFMGEVGNWYNLISSSDFNINAHFAETIVDGKRIESNGVPLTLVDELAFVYNGHELILSVNGTAILDGEIIDVDTTIPLGPGVYVLWRHGGKSDSSPVATLPAEFRDMWFGDEIHIPAKVGIINYKGLETKVSLVSTPRMANVKFFDLNFFRPIFMRSLQLHGVVGQTSVGTVAERGLQYPVIGMDKDYRVSGPFARDFSFNLYRA